MPEPSKCPEPLSDTDHAAASRQESKPGLLFAGALSQTPCAVAIKSKIGPGCGNRDGVTSFIGTELGRPDRLRAESRANGCVLHKLYWHTITPSDRQLQDAAGGLRRADRADWKLPACLRC